MQAHTLSSSAARNLNPSGSISSVAEGPGLAHDARNLLAGLGLYCDLLNLPGVLRPEHLHYARELRLLSERSTALINRMLASSLALPKPPPTVPSRRETPAAVVRAFAPLLRVLAAPDAIVTMTVAPGLPALPFSAEVLERILVNLTRNAALALRSQAAAVSPGDASPGRIRIGVSASATRLRLIVTDNGPGMPAAAAAAFMKPLPLPTGSVRGLGHRVIGDLLQSTGGKLSINVSPGQGTALQIDWPIVPAAQRGRPSGATQKRSLRGGAILSC